MKHALLFCLLWPSVAFGQVVKAQLTAFAPDKLKLGPRCGTFMVASMLPFRLLDPQGPQQAGDTVLVVFPCPQQHGQGFFVNGARYELTLSELATAPEWPQGWTLISYYTQRAWPQWWCRGITRVK